MCPDTRYMQEVFELAKKGLGSTSPNPLVGALLVKNNKVISTGYHARYGTEHAELLAIENAKAPLHGATLYCNLEPCCHLDKQTPPCAQRIIKEKIARVVIANRDPNPKVNGKGITMLRDAGIEVCEGLSQENGEALNAVYFTAQIKKRPFIHLKWAQTLDGNIATIEGNSNRISNAASLEKVHEMRRIYDAILIGKNTLLNDNPRLTCRLTSVIHAPKRVVLSDLQSISEELTVFSDEFKNRTILITSAAELSRYPEKAARLQNRGIDILEAEADISGKLNILQVVTLLKSHNVHSVLIEGGAAILTSFIQQHMWDRISIFIAPMFVGNGLHALADLGIKKISDAIHCDDIRYEIIGNNIHCMINNKK